ncbi:MAG: hypothetical protein ACW98K_16045 [Candidatus Kariarchaeaceae archaeon]|jgi:hypothetical protein
MKILRSYFVLTELLTIGMLYVIPVGGIDTNQTGVFLIEGSLALKFEKTSDNPKIERVYMTFDISSDITGQVDIWHRIETTDTYEMIDDGGLTLSINPGSETFTIEIPSEKFYVSYHVGEIRATVSGKRLDFCQIHSQLSISIWMGIVYLIISKFQSTYKLMFRVMLTFGLK